ncbi:MAG: transglutaminase domain-containing protein, partial [Chloroflexi bacterium]|nr:transglutaminase domain-containing protein [Chloroflexota bacterium]
RTTTYSEYVGDAFVWGATQGGDRDANVDVLLGSPEDPARLPGRRPVTVEITLETYREALILSPQTVQRVDQPTHVQLIPGSRWFVNLEPRSSSKTYTVTALVPLRGDEGSGLTQNRLKAAGENYPASITSTYLGVPDDALGPDATQLLEEIKSLAGDVTPYEKAVLVESILRDSGRFAYRVDVREQNCDAGVVECFARFRAGYCQMYAFTMAILLREMGIPSRVAQGFLPGRRDASGHEVVLNSGAHAWVEVFFPDIGWVDFDPTAGGVALEEDLPLGSPVAPRPSPSLGFSSPDEFDDETGDPSRPPGGTGGVTNPTGGAGPFIAIGILLIISVAGLAYIAWRRGPRRPMEPDVAWRGVLSIARRFGFGPQPAQTVFEYAGVLADEVPQVRPELQTVARGKVEVAYGQRLLGDDRKRAIAEASRRLRLGLLRLAFRRRRRKGKGPRPI